MSTALSNPDSFCPTQTAIVIGSGVIGLGIAYALCKRGWHVTVISRGNAEAASRAAAGMLAPQAEGLVPGPMLDLCLRSRSRYPSWVAELETLTGESVGYWPCGILAPVYAAPDQAEAASRDPNCPTEWLSQEMIQNHQPGLATTVAGGFWYPKDAQVDNQTLVQTLQRATHCLGVVLEEGVAVQAIARQGDRVTHVQTSAGDRHADHYILATGAWSQDLLPVPVFPRKGEMLSLRPPTHMTPQPPAQVLFGPDIYIVPRKTGRIVLGATVEDVGFRPGTTAAGLRSLLDAAIRLYPPLADYQFEDHWWGFRPATPDEEPILGPSPWQNLTLATGHYRNGILLAPATADLVADWVHTRQADPLLEAFSYQRFSSVAI